MALNVDFTFDKETYRHYMNGFLSVLHCHHYLCLTTKMAEDFDDLGGITILRETAEETIKPLFDDYIRKNNLTELEDRLAVGVEYYSVMGLGKMRVSAKEGGGEAQLARSHIDTGWIKKWGISTTHHNHFTCGYIAAIFASTFERELGSYQVQEVQSIVTGDKSSLFQVQLKG